MGVKENLDGKGHELLGGITSAIYRSLKFKEGMGGSYGYGRWCGVKKEN